MTADAQDIVRALVALSETHPNGKALLRDVCALLRRRVQDVGGIPDIVLTTPSGSEPQMVSAVGALLRKKFGDDVTLTERRDPALIGGAILQIGDEQIDLSVRGALAELELKLRSTSLVS